VQIAVSSPSLRPPESSFDPHYTLARPDLAAQALEGWVRASTYRPTTAMRVRVPVLDICDAPSGTIVDQLLYGEAFDVLERHQGHSWGQARRQGRVGWVDQSGLEALTSLPTHRVKDLGQSFPVNALTTEPAGAADLSPVGDFASDPASAVETWVGVPYLAGGRSSRGTDATGLVEQALTACGRAAPRTVEAQAGLGQEIARSDLRRGDVVVWTSAAPRHRAGHSGVMLDGDRLIHASAPHGGVIIEPLDRVESQLRAEGASSPLFRRPTF